MRVAIVPFQFPVLSETFVINIATGLLDRGHDVEIFPLYGKYTQNNITHWAVKEYGLLEKTYYPPQIRILSREFYWPLWCRFLCFRLERNFDIVHFQFGAAALKCLPLKYLGFFKAKWVVSFRGFDISSFVKENGVDVYKKLFLEGDLFLSNSEYFRERLIALGCASNRAFVYRSGVDCDRFKFRHRPLVSSEPIKIVSVGRLVEKKGFEYSIKAIIDLIHEGYDIEYQVIGVGPLYDQLKKLISGACLEGKIRLSGPQDQQYIVNALSESHIFVSSGVDARDGDQNGPDNTIKEAMAVGLPVVASKSGAIQEVVIDSKTGLLVEERNVDQLARKIKLLIQNPNLWKDLTKNAREFVQEKYNLQFLTDELIDRYQSVLK